MKLIKREYLKDLIDVIGTPDIKIITGVRRSGMSKLLEMFKNYIIENIKNYNIIGINFNLVKFDNLRDYISLNNYIEKQYIEGKNKKLKKQYVRTGQTLYSTYIEVKEGVSETDWIAFPYGKAVKEGAPVKELEGSGFADQLY